MLKRFSVNLLVDDEYRYRVQMIVIPFVLGIVAFGMFLLNLFTGKTLLMYATLFFSIASLANTAVTCKIKNSLTPSYCIFFISILALFTYFLLYGGTEGFSPIWICLLPACGQLLVGRRKGMIMTGAMFLITVFLLWTPVGRGFLLYQYTQSFCMRFPLVYISFWLVGTFFETIRLLTYNELIKVKEKYLHLSTHDTLTGVYNRYWFNARIRATLQQEKPSCALLMLDVDFFKHINDTYGHLFGDRVLCQIAAALERETAGQATVCRWGGEEFAVLIENGDVAQASRMAERLRATIGEHTFVTTQGEKVKITVSIGVAMAAISDKTPETLVSTADKALYQAKEKGRNCVCGYA